MALLDATVVIVVDFVVVFVNIIVFVVVDVLKVFVVALLVDHIIFCVAVLLCWGWGWGCDNNQILRYTVLCD